MSGSKFGTSGNEDLSVPFALQIHIQAGTTCGQRDILEFVDASDQRFGPLMLLCYVTSFLAGGLVMSARAI